MDEDDRMVANVLMMRARRISSMALLMGAGAVVISVLPHTGLLLPAKVYGLCTVVPIVFGLAAIPGALLGLSTFNGQPPGVMMALRARGMAAVGLQALIGAVLGLIGIVSGALALWWMQVG
jgi:hypothetical protein